jgi:hypothetical protein
MACERLAGITGLSVDGNAYMVVSDVTWSPSTVDRKTLPGLDSIHGYSEVPVQGFIEATLRDSSAISVKDFNSQVCVEVQVTLANGKLVGGAALWTVNVQEVRAAEGTFMVRWEGVDVSETFA